MSRTGPSIGHGNFRWHYVNTTNKRLVLSQDSILQTKQDAC